MRSILHSDLNNFYASVECVKHPEWRAEPLIVVGNIEDRHGVVLAKNAVAKEFGIKTGDVIWQARNKCGNVREVVADMPLYIEYSRAVRAIYEQYTDRIESFGIDECWLDVTESRALFGDGAVIAHRIRREIKEKLGITVSIGVSYNKIFAKLASELKKPDAVSIISPDNYRVVAWELPVENLLYVGSATKRKLNRMGIRTIGDLARTDEKLLIDKLGKWGLYLSRFARGEDDDEVKRTDEADVIKSIGNSLTCYKDLTDYDEADNLIYMLADSVAARLRESGYGKAGVCTVCYRTNRLQGYIRRRKMPYPTALARDIAAAASAIFREISDMSEPVRSISVSVSEFTRGAEQVNIMASMDGYDREEKLERAMDDIRRKYGNMSVKRAVELRDKRLGSIDIKAEHTVHPTGFRLRKSDSGSYKIPENH